MIALNNRLPKRERLTGKTAVETLFTKGEALFLFPIRVIFYKTTSTDTGVVQALFSVPKKQHKRATARNRHKRLMREAYRLHKQNLLQTVSTKPFGVHIAFVLINNHTFSYRQIAEQVTQALQQIEEMLK
ncbi:MAG: ribonuclease P protein component [Prevotellaceae bacterium]|jgi:ribonuclease P protein component|nr:ribonuclease P protein component [Prevotellaceae bacterium]